MKKILLLITLLTGLLFADQKSFLDLSDVDQEVVKNVMQQMQAASQQSSQSESKLGSAVVMKMDSSKEKHSYTYSIHSFDSWATYSVQLWENNEWQDYMHTVYNYDSNGNFIGGVTKLWQDGSWMDIIRYSQSYNNDNLVIASKSEWWYGSTWEVIFQSTTTYGENFSVEETESFFMGATKDRETDIYDANENTISVMNENWENEEWVKKDSTAIQYNSDNSPVLEVHYYRGSINNWLEGEHIFYSYDSNKNRVLELTQEWDGEAYKDKYQKVLSFNSDNYLTEVLDQYMDNTGWINYIRYTYNYSGDGVLLHGVCENWNSGESQWIKKDGEFHIFDTKGWYTDYGTHGQSYLFEGQEIDANYDGVTAIRNDNRVVSDFSLSQNYPNPFNPTTNIKFSIPMNEKVKISVYNTVGQLVASLVDENKSAGNYQVTWDASNFGSGVYFIKIKAGNFTQTNKCILMK